MDAYHEIATLSSLHEALNDELMVDSGRTSPGQVTRQKHYRDIVSQLQAINMEEAVIRLVAEGVNPEVLARVEAQISHTLRILEERKQVYDKVEFGCLLDLYEKYCYERQYSRIKEDVEFISSYPYPTEQERSRLLNESTHELNRLDNERAEFRRNNAEWIGTNFYSKIERLCLSNKRIISSYYSNKDLPVQEELSSVKNEESTQKLISPEEVFKSRMYDRFLVLEDRLIQAGDLDKDLRWIALHKNGKPDIRRLVTLIVGLLDNDYFLPNRDVAIRLFFETRYHIVIGQNFERRRREMLRGIYKIAFHDLPF